LEWTRRSCKQHTSPSAERNCPFNPSAELLATAASRQKWLIDAFDEDTAILHRFNVVRDVDDLARGGIGINELARCDELCGGQIFLVRATRHDLQCIIRQRSL
jgi:hypothetical protein